MPSKLSCHQSLKCNQLLSNFETQNAGSVQSWNKNSLSAGCAFHSTKNSGLNFRKLLVANGTALSRISGKEGNLASYIQFFGNFLPGISVPLDLPREFPEFLEEWFAFQKFHNFRIFRQLFQEISLPFAPVLKFPKFLVEWNPSEYMDIKLNDILKM